MSALRRAAPRTAQSATGAAQRRIAVSPFLGKGDGGMASCFPLGERLRSPFLGEGDGGTAVQ